MRLVTLIGRGRVLLAVAGDLNTRGSGRKSGNVQLLCSLLAERAKLDAKGETQVPCGVKELIGGVDRQPALSAIGVPAYACHHCCNRSAYVR